MGDDVSIRVAAADDWDAIHRLLSMAFHDVAEDEMRQVEGSVYEPERGLVATNGSAVVGHAAAYTRELTVPGAILPAAHVTLVSVAPTHRRRGILSRMIRRQLDDIAAGGREPIAVLWASEGRIYPRYGYGLAAQRLTLSAKTRELALPGSPRDKSELRLVDPGQAVGELTKLYEQLRAERVGWSSRDDRWWRFVLADNATLRRGATELHGVVHDGPDGPTGYATWRTKGGWDDTGPTGRVQVHEVVAADPETYASLWRFLFGIDLARTLHATYLPVDDPLTHLVTEPRQLGTKLQDGLWIRIVDLPGALAARRYAAEVDVVLDVTDGHFEANTGRWRLTGGPDGAACVPSGDPADLACTSVELGAAYLGGTSLASLAAAGRVRELTPGALNRASLAFGWHRMPAPLQIF
ncbi:GNAT family N-acetyltransferase [Actinoplanes sp. NBRC 103695]|uniref:GNAT family N-acetyltransferase n=1 Tax=Actinoplanes sp. NBRC 103695 TaxID=3032202 RepID=UPI0025523289|nr:GNAT family N-acetyltransferase [Actinoplanes sp. NBRC 103695]